VCIVPSATGIESWDAGHSAYVAAARADHRYNNPIAMVFLEAIQQDLRKMRLQKGRIKLRTHLRNSLNVRKLSKQFSAGGNLEAAASRESLLLDFDDDGGREVADAQIGALLARKRAVHRWQLLLMLHLNPSLRNLRAFKLDADGIEGIDERQVFAKTGQDMLNVGKGVVDGTKQVASATGTFAQGVASVTKDVVDVASRDISKRVQMAREPGYVRDADGNWVSETDLVWRPPWSRLPMPSAPEP